MGKLFPFIIKTLTVDPKLSIAFKGDSIKMTECEKPLKGHFDHLNLHEIVARVTTSESHRTCTLTMI